MLIALSILLGLLAGACNWFYDMGLLKPYLLNDKFNPRNTDKNKWELSRINRNTIGTPNRWYHWWYLGIYVPKNIERFPFSSTILVGFTDWWHRFQMLYKGLLTAACVISVYAVQNFDLNLFFEIAIIIKLAYIPFSGGWHLMEWIIKKSR